MTMKRIIFLLTLSIICGSMHAQKPPQYEFRAVWIATVENIDWPSKKGISTEEQKAEFIALLDLHQKNGMNAILMHIRPAADAFYPSKFEPWSEYLTGIQGLAPYPYYDPLQFMIEETHKRGMEFHAWLNPYRAVNNLGASSISPNHITKMFPQWFINYGGKKYFDPGLPTVREHINRVIEDIVRRYDIDAIHFDDYFYPYPEATPFHDEVSYAKYGKGSSLNNWRRSNVDSIILKISKTIKSIKPYVKFGISPFGIWRNQCDDPRGSCSKAAITNYDNLFADILLWLKNGWIDYVVPQLYWETSHSYLGYNMLMDWWSKNTFGRQLFIGHGIYRSLESRKGAWKTTTEIPRQIRALRENAEVKGSVYFSSKTFESNPNGWNDSLKNNYYKYPAIVPPMSWIDNVPPVAPLKENEQNGTIKISYNGTEPIKEFAVYLLGKNEEEYRENATLIQLIVADKTITFDPATIGIKPGEKLFISAVDRNNNVSEWIKLM